MKKAAKKELQRTVKDINSFIEYLKEELEIKNISELYTTPEEEKNFLINAEKHFTDNFEPQIRRGLKLYF